MCARCEELEERVAWLEGELGLRAAADELQAIRQGFGVTVGQARVLLLLFRARGTVTVYQILEALPPRNSEDRCEHLAKVYVCRIRDQIGRGAIENVWGAGYRLSDEARVRVAAILAVARRQEVA